MILVEYDGITPVLRIMGERMDDATQPLTKILEDGLLSAQEQVVEGKGARFGQTKWPEMAKATIKKGRDPLTLLVENGMLARSLSRGQTGNIFEVGPTEGEAGTNLVSPRSGYPYAARQQVEEPAAHRPARPYVAWYEERFADYDRLMLDWFMGGTAA